jgi:hypothetical protein
MTRVTSLAKLRVPLGGQAIELQRVDFAGQADGQASPHPTLPLLRTRIREGSRFTVFDIDPDTARAWGEALVAWADDSRAGLATPPRPAGGQP